jgi:hypothetical protein
MMKKMFCSALICALSVLPAAYPMERPAVEEETQIVFKDHLPTPDGGHMRVLYHPLKELTSVATFDAHGISCGNALDYSSPIKAFFQDSANGLKKFEMSKICGIAQYRHYLLYAAIGSKYRERDTLIVAAQNNLRDGRAFRIMTIENGFAVIDISSLSIGKSRVVCNAIIRDNIQKKYADRVVDLSEARKHFFPDLD